MHRKLFGILMLAACLTFGTGIPLWLIRPADILPNGAATKTFQAIAMAGGIMDTVIIRIPALIVTDSIPRPALTGADRI